MHEGNPPVESPDCRRLRDSWNVNTILRKLCSADQSSDCYIMSGGLKSIPDSLAAGRLPATDLLFVWPSSQKWWCLNQHTCLLLSIQAIYSVVGKHARPWPVLWAPRKADNLLHTDHRAMPGVITLTCVTNESFCVNIYMQCHGVSEISVVMA